MTALIDLPRSAPAVLAALEQPGSYLARDSDLEPELLVLVQVHVANRSGCVECARGYARAAKRTGENGHRLRLLHRWREAAGELYTRRERTALAWAEALLLASGEDEWVEARRGARTDFSERDLADLSLAVLSSMAWSRMAVAVGCMPPGAVDAAGGQPIPTSAPSSLAKRGGNARTRIAVR